MGRIENAFSAPRRPRPTPKGSAGFDNSRENIDPHVKTKVVNTKELVVTGDFTPQGRLILAMGELSYFAMSGTSITISSQSNGSTNMVVVNPTSTFSSGAHEFDNGGSDNSRLRYTGATTRHFHIALSVSFSGQNNNDVWVLGIAKNGTVIDGSKIQRKVGNANDVGSTAMHIAIMMDTNDYLELYCGNTSDTSNFTINTINFFAMGL